MAGQQKSIAFTLNGRAVSVDVGVHQTLTEVLQETFGLFGARESCGQGLCGCCTVQVDGEPVSGCLYFAAFADGRDVVTVEHIGSTEVLSPEQEAFIECGAFQCGFCTPGFILMTRKLLDRHPEPSDDDIRHYLSGNLCRCAAYPEIIKAVKLAGEKRKAAAT
jgi:carbon-monoxide dehydrogenase small subunit